MTYGGEVEEKERKRTDVKRHEKDKISKEKE